MPVDALDVCGLRLVPARGRVEERIVEPALPELAHDPVLLLVVVVTEDVEQQPKRRSLPSPEPGER